MKILDRYLIKQFVQTFLFGLLAFTLLFVLIDMMENLDDFIDQDVPGQYIFEFYLVFIPEIIRLMLPVSILLSGLFTTGKLVNLNELTAMKSAGISIFRYLIPFVIVSFIISTAAVYFGGYIVPEANKHKIFIEQTFMKKGIVFSGSNIYFQDNKTRIVSVSFYDKERNQANRVSIQEFDPDDHTIMTKRIDANRMVYDSAKSSWILNNGTERSFSGDFETSADFSSKELHGLNFKPEDILKKQQKPEEMSLAELLNFADEQLRSGNDPTVVLIEFHSKIAFAFSCLIVILFGVPISTNKRKGSLAIQFGINILITFIYLVFMKISQAFGKNGVLQPFITAWAANFLFIAGAIINLIRVRR